MKKLKEKWFHPKVDTGWDKDMLPETRRELMLKAHGGDVLASAKAMQALANVTRDNKTRYEAQQDARYFYKMHKRAQSPIISHDTQRITARLPRISSPVPRISLPMPRIR
jgi:hypothetical protein